MAGDPRVTLRWQSHGAVVNDKDGRSASLNAPDRPTVRLFHCAHIAQKYLHRFWTLKNSWNALKCDLVRRRYCDCLSEFGAGYKCSDLLIRPLLCKKKWRMLAWGCQYGKCAVETCLLNRCICSLGGWQCFSFILLRRFCGFLGSYPREYIFFKIRKLCQSEWWSNSTASSLNEIMPLPRLYGMYWSRKAFRAKLIGKASLKKFGDDGRGCDPRHFMQFICGHTTRKCFDVFHLFKNCWNAFSTD